MSNAIKCTAQHTVAFSVHTAMSITAKTAGPHQGASFLRALSWPNR